MHATSFDTLPVAVPGLLDGLVDATTLSTPVPATMSELAAGHALRAATADARRRGRDPRFTVTSVHSSVEGVIGGREPVELACHIMAASLGRTVVRCVATRRRRRVAEAIVILDGSAEGAGTPPVAGPRQGLGGWRLPGSTVA